jgi:dTDP-4-amino-4,6-dideoxygalactose transaminase
MAVELETIPFGRPVLGDEERAAVADVLSGHVLTHGPRMKLFEESFAEFTGAEHAVATASCAAALHLSYLGLELGPGDEVIVPAQTHVATAHAVEACGARAVFVDSDARTGNMDLDAAESAVTPRTRALSLVHYLGLPVDMARVAEIARRHGLFVVEDCALALGAKYDGTHVGLHGDVGCFSFYPVKHITTGEGGMAITRRGEVAERLSKQRAFGIDKTVVAERRHSGAYDVELLGLNYRLGEIGAALGIEQLKRLPGFLETRRRNFDLLREGLADVEGVTVLETGTAGAAESAYYCLAALLESPLDRLREEAIELLKQRGVGASIYYPKPLPDTTYYRERYGHRPGEFPVAARISATSLALPVGPHVDETDVERILVAIDATLEELRARA